MFSGKWRADAKHFSCRPADRKSRQYEFSCRFSARHTVLFLASYSCRCSLAVSPQENYSCRSFRYSCRFYAHRVSRVSSSVCDVIYGDIDNYHIHLSYIYLYGTHVSGKTTWWPPLLLLWHACVTVEIDLHVHVKIIDFYVRVMSCFLLLDWSIRHMCMRWWPSGCSTGLDACESRVGLPQARYLYGLSVPCWSHAVRRLYWSVVASTFMY
jgi:hypothetical protein